MPQGRITKSVTARLKALSIVKEMKEDVTPTLIMLHLDDTKKSTSIRSGTFYL